MSRAALRASLTLWTRRLRFRQRRLKVSVRRHRTNSARKWRKHVDEAHRMVSRREGQLAAKRPRREKAADIMAAWARKPVREVGGNNVGAAVEKIIREGGGTKGDPWCGWAVAAAYKRAGSKTVTRPWGYVPALEQLLTRVAHPRRGHVVIFNFDGGVPDHTGLFEKDNRDGTIDVWEGNTRPGTSASDAGGGEGVYLRTRPKRLVQSIRRVRG